MAVINNVAIVNRKLVIIPAPFINHTLNVLVTRVLGFDAQYPLSHINEAGF